MTADKSKCVEMKSAMKMSLLVVIIGYILFSSILWISSLRGNGDNDVITEQHHAHRKLWKIRGIDVNDPHTTGLRQHILCRMESLSNDNTHRRKLWLNNDPHTEELRQQEPNAGTFSTTDDSSNESPNIIIQPYTLQNVLQAIPYWENTVGVMIYDPPSDKFILHYSKHMRWLPPCMKVSA